MTTYCVELFGLARVLAGRPNVDVEVPDDATVRTIVRALAIACPQLVGPILLPGVWSPGAGYTLSINGLSFVDDLDTSPSPGDALLLLPAAAGG